MPDAVNDSMGSSVGGEASGPVGKARISALMARPSMRVHSTLGKKRIAASTLCRMTDPDTPASLETHTDDPVLASFRRSIDNIDAALIHMLAERFRITQAVGDYKAKVTLPPADPEREKRQIARLRALAEEASLDPEFSEKFLRFIIDEVIRHHERAQLR
jgi:chorismate mutase